jgi:hypothetical protein
MDLSTVSSDSVIESYRRQLSEAHHRIAILEAQLKKAEGIIREQGMPNGSEPR